MQSLPNYSEALELGLSVVKPICLNEQVNLEQAFNRILALDVIADRDEPPFHRSQMDGYAVVAREVSKGKQMDVLGEVAAGATFDGIIKPDSCVSIATGAPVPNCFDAVVQHELTDCGNEVVTFLCGDVLKGKSIHLKGVDAKTGDVLIPTRTRLKPQHLGIAASVGMVSISVLSMPRVVVFTSGDEVITPEETPLPHQIRNGNSPMVCEAFRSMGCDVVEVRHIRDDESATKQAVEQALDGRCDLVVTVGGISAGKRDYFPSAFEHANVKLVLQGANIQPGKPIVIGSHLSGVVLGLPGNPVSALACCCLFGWPILLKMLGCSTQLPWRTLPLANSVKPNPKRTAFRPSQIVNGKIVIPSWHGSGDLAHTLNTNGLTQLPASVDELAAGALVSSLAYPW